MNTHRLILHCYAVAIFCGFFIAHRAFAVDALLVQDTYVDSSKATTNYGTNGNLIVSKSSTATARAFLKFNIATLPPGTVATDIKQARLRLWVNSSSASVGAITLTPVTSAWGETTLTNSTSSSLTFGLPKHANLPVSFIGQFVSLDVTDWVQAWLAGTLVNEGFQIDTGTNSTTLSLYFDSKESTTTSHEPQLEIVLNGPAGPQGSPGPQGPQGIQGLTGPAGPAGAVGPQGPQGSAGATGSPGPQGSPGAAGAQGPQGVAGVNGSQWYSGVGSPAQGSGITNDYYLNTASGDLWQKLSSSGTSAWSLQGNIRGPQGAAGAQGVQGPQGPAGAKGDTGAAGPAGVAGPPGPVGAAGSAGADGASGPPGPQGIAGANGAKWYSWNGAPSQNLGTRDDYYLDLTTGDVWLKVPNEALTSDEWALQGNIRGPQGTAGASGPAGPAGATGPQGAPGAAGAKGDTGAVGAQGPAGSTGLTGAAGAQGPAGPAGPQGPQGPAGAWPTRLSPQGDLSMGEFTNGPTP